VTTDSDHKLPIAPNLLDRNFTADSANQKWAGDIAYLYTSEGWMYLAVIIDLHSRTVISWSISDRMQASLVCNALKAALLHGEFPKRAFVYSDRGSQYSSNDYRDLLSKYSHQQSISRKGNCWDNAYVKS
jgi:putative transposase